MENAAHDVAWWDEQLPYHEFVAKLMAMGVRPDGTSGLPGEPWTPKTLAGKLGIDARTIRYCCQGKHLPADPRSYETAFFGSNEAWSPIRARFRAAYNAATNRSRINPDRQTLVTAPHRCIGREAEIAALIQAMTSPDAVAVVGPPEVGKTTLVRQVASSQPVIERFGPRRWFVALEAANDAPALQTAIVGAVGLDPALARFPDVLELLSRKESLLVLDNLETPWEQDLGAVQDCLGKLSALQNIKIVVSLRGSMAPIAPVFNRLIKVEPLPSIEARRLFLALAPDISPDDPHLDPLLNELYGMPRAVELVAYRAAPFRTLQNVLKEWRAIGLTLATHPDQPIGRKTSVERSIALSWQSPRLKREGRRLFCMLGQSPGGMRNLDVDRLLKQDAHEASRQLLATGLAFERTADRIDLLPIIRAFARKLPPVANDDIVRLRNHYLRRVEYTDPFLRRGKYMVSQQLEGEKARATETYYGNYRNLCLALLAKDNAERTVIRKHPL